MISENLSHETFLTDPAFANLPGVEYKTIEYQNYQYLKLGKGDVLTKTLNKAEPIKRCTFVQPKRGPDGKVIDSTRGVIPRILQGLLGARKATRKRLAQESDPFKRALLDALQAAFKVGLLEALHAIFMSDLPMLMSSSVFHR